MSDSEKHTIIIKKSINVAESKDITPLDSPKLYSAVLSDGL